MRVEETNITMLLHMTSPADMPNGYLKNNDRLCCPAMPDKPYFIRMTTNHPELLLLHNGTMKGSLYDMTNIIVLCPAAMADPTNYGSHSRERYYGSHSPER